ncbi:MAG: HEAT repeat domain-containing protein [Planctomycetes bacterium]|nr:HEAT repeat domain-containing protein [Planctomycetota bacterium]MCB9869062.1 HEAT repeat domain-containing protein [Planctomycetota bacterium]MCB9888020.1 HEAT repeat domain-containing protein [Planctomycetota bacterium]
MRMLLAVLCLSLPLAGQDGGDPTADLAAFDSWLKDYKSGAIRLLQKGQVVESELNRVRAVISGVAKWNTLTTAKRLFELASLDILPPGSARSSTDRAAFLTEIRIFQVRGLARDAIATMDAREIEDWLLEVVKKRPDKAYGDVASASGAALRILAQRPSERAKKAMLEACGSFKPEVRVHAVNAMSTAPSLALVPHFAGLLRDKEPYVRIAAINGMCRALAPHTDETRHAKVEAKIAQLRDTTIDAIRPVILRDKVWQVRACARENLAILKTKKSIPVLIEALAAELARKKDPWSLDVRLHRTLEGLTGIRMPLGQVQTWQAFWRKEGATFAFAREQPKGKQNGKEAKSSKYEKFFKLELQSNRLLFVIDLSGSMVEPITLKTFGVGTGAGAPEKRTTTKAKLVVEELKKMVMTLKDGDLFNIIVFSDDVRVWRARDDGRPALVKMSDQVRDDLLGGYLDNLQPAGLTNLHGALDCALGFGGRGLHDKYYELGYDTLYVLSDGAPTTGKVTDTEEILRMVREVNSLRRLTINTITFGFLNQVAFLKKLAEQNGGRHIHVD